MAVSDKSEISIKNLSNLLKRGYILYKNNSSHYKDYLDIEESIYDRFSPVKKSIYLDEIESNTDIDIHHNILKDITNYETMNPIIDRMHFQLSLKYFEEEIPTTDDPFSSVLFDGIKNGFILNYSFEHKIRNIFFDLLENHISASTGMSKVYLDTLHSIMTDLKFKYNHTKNKRLLIPSMRYYDITNYNQTALDERIYKTINEILSYTDEQLENDIIYAKAITLQTLLRSLFVILNSYEALADYEELYINSENEIAKNIVKTAFISNYYDINSYQKKLKNNGVNYGI